MTDAKEKLNFSYKMYISAKFNLNPFTRIYAASRSFVSLTH